MTKGTAFNQVRCRPDRGNWAIVVLLGGMGIAPILCFWLTPSPMADRIMMSVLGMVFVIPALLLAVWQLRAQVIADAHSLRWRGFGGWHLAAWGEVTDYYDKLLPKKGVTAVIEAGGQRLQISESFWKQNPEFRAVVTQSATRARASDWGVWGTRPEQDWPRVFGYQTSDNRSTAFGMPLFLVVALALPATFVPKVVNTFSTLGWAWGVASVGALLLGLGPMFLLLTLFQIQSRDLLRRWKQSVRVSRDGLTFSGDGTDIQTAWDEITDYYVAPRQGFNLGLTYAVVTKSGAFDFSSAIGDVGILTRSIAENAKATGQQVWRSLDDEVLGGAAQRWTSGCEGVGERIYHYRTRMNRALLWFPTAMLLIPLLTASLAPLGLTPPPDWYGVAIAWLIPVWGWWRYYTAGIVVDAEGITQRSLFGLRRLRWDQVERFYMSGDDVFKFGNVVGDGTRIRFWIGVADVEELKTEIARRATQSRNRTWDEETVPSDRRRAAER